MAQPSYEQPYQGYAQQPTVAYASWIQRVGGYVIDALAVAPFSILGLIFGRGTDEATGLPTFNALYWVFALLGIAVAGYNRWWLGGKTGQTWGRKALGLKLVSEATGQPIGPGMAFARDVTHILDSLACYVGWLFPLWDAKKQTFADKIIKTVVTH